jgi:hypothetical protein
METNACTNKSIERERSRPPPKSLANPVRAGTPRAENPPLRLTVAAAGCRFSYGRALQDPALEAWNGRDENLVAGQRAFFQRARLNGRWRRHRQALMIRRNWRDD